MTLPMRAVTLDSIPPQYREHYVEIGGVYLLDVEDHPNALHRAARHERRLRVDAERQCEELRTRSATETKRLVQEATPAALQAEKDAADKRWQARWDARTAELERERSEVMPSLAKDVDRLLIAEQAQRIVGVIAIPGSAGVLVPHIASRLRVAVGADGKRAVVVVDERGLPSTMTTDALAETFKRDSRFAPVLRDGVNERADHARRVAETLGHKPNGVTH